MITLSHNQFNQLNADLDAMGGIIEAMDTLQSGLWALSDEEQANTMARLVRVSQIYHQHLLQLFIDIDPLEDEDLPIFPDAGKPALQRVPSKDDLRVASTGLLRQAQQPCYDKLPSTGSATVLRQAPFDKLRERVKSV